MTKVSIRTATGIRSLAQRINLITRSQWVSHHIGARQRQILEYLATEPEHVTLTGVAAALQVAVATAGESVPALRTKRLVSTARHETDARAVALALTKEGWAYIEELQKKGDPLKEALRILSQRDQRTYRALTARLIEALDAKLSPSQEPIMRTRSRTNRRPLSPRASTDRSSVTATAA